MFKKAAAAAAIALIALFAAPAAAHADYVPEGNISVSGSTAPGGTVIVTFSAGSFFPGEPISFTVTGEPTPSLATLGIFTGTVSGDGNAGGDGSFQASFVIPTNGTGVYTFTATGLESGNVGSASITVTPADAGGGTDSGLVNTGSTVSALVIWGAVGMLLIGTATVAAITVARREKISA
ncbi:hypothetical protein M2152_002065 [Microbacteriaceae bacterium SG_E_30_P1]|uniref:Uncharacterized protein n=1 Tax=Antiquaquibacter oligotrophicus TaxID=2880260 RepID=A0ABT6KQX1_9MICO|nr:hypothetical protein [Antiquaquibacter oligotrophicus]MDH6181883.1 hypothetical protein [Antiquaquibacter oligotrophicus]UDF12442.1 hypothetical protein LH407_09765 [Antiquaquibacter oligotrophicus]